MSKKPKRRKSPSAKAKLKGPLADGEPIDLSKWKLPAIDTFIDAIADAVDLVAKKATQEAIAYAIEQDCNASFDDFAESFDPYRIVITLPFGHSPVDPSWSFDLSEVVGEFISGNIAPDRFDESSAPKAIALRDALRGLANEIDEHIATDAPTDRPF
jgi:hypothetical protein